MAIDIYGNGTGLFETLGKLFSICEAPENLRRNTLPQKVQAFLEQLEAPAGADTELYQRGLALNDAAQQYDAGANWLMADVETIAQQLVRYYVENGTPGDYATLEDLLDQLEQEMRDGGYYVAANTLSVATSASASSDVALSATLLQPDGRLSQQAYAETLQIAAQGWQLGQLYLRLRGEEAADRYSRWWPAGSGLEVEPTVLGPANSLLANADFESWNNDTPADWIVRTGQPGTTIAATQIEQQRLTIQNATQGTFVLVWQWIDGKQYATRQLAYNASAGQIEDALRGLPGLAEVQVESDDQGFLISFEGCPGGINTLQAINYTDGTITVSVATAGEQASWLGRSLKLVGSGGENTTLIQPVEIPQDSLLLVALRLWREDTTTTGVLQLRLVDAVDGATLQDAAGNQLSWSVDLSTLSAGYQFLANWWAGPAQLPAATYFELKLTSGLPDGKSIALDDLVLAGCSNLYSGGPAVALVRGRKDIQHNDSWTVTVSNDWAGKWQWYWARVFGRTLPTSGTTQIPDSLIQ